MGTPKKAARVLERVCGVPGIVVGEAYDAETSRLSCECGCG